jgi:hypothetical protein
LNFQLTILKRRTGYLYNGISFENTREWLRSDNKQKLGSEFRSEFGLGSFACICLADS